MYKDVYVNVITPPAESTEQLPNVPTRGDLAVLNATFHEILERFKTDVKNSAELLKTRLDDCKNFTDKNHSRSDLISPDVSLGQNYELFINFEAPRFEFLNSQISNLSDGRSCSVRLPIGHTNFGSSNGMCIRAVFHFRDLPFHKLSLERGRGSNDIML